MPGHLNFNQVMLGPKLFLLCRKLACSGHMLSFDRDTITISLHLLQGCSAASGLHHALSRLKKVAYHDHTVALAYDSFTACTPAEA